MENPMAQLMLINPKRRTRRAKSASPKRRRRTVARMAAPRRRRHVARVAHNPIRRRRHHTMSRRRVRRNLIEGGMGGTTMSAVVGAAGAVVVDVVTGYIPLPASMMTGYGPSGQRRVGPWNGHVPNRTLKRMGGRVACRRLRCAQDGNRRNAPGLHRPGSNHGRYGLCQSHSDAWPVRRARSDGHGHARHG